MLFTNREREEREEFTTRLAWAPLFVDFGYVKFFTKTQRIMSISINVHQSYVCDPLGLYLSLVNISKDPIAFIGKI